MPVLWSSRRTDEYLLLFEGRFRAFIFFPSDNSYLYTNSTSWQFFAFCDNI